MRVPRACVLMVDASLVIALAATSCGSGDGAAPTTDQDTPNHSPLPPELAGAVQQPDGTYLTADGRAFAAPDEFASQDCGAARWPAAHDTVDRAVDAGVPADSVEWLTHHVHAFVGVWADGEAEIVPAGIGIDNDGHRIAGLHTHDCSGTVHIEVEEEVDLTLGQLADTWGVRLDEECFDDLCGPESPVSVRLNGEPIADPRGVPISGCDVIVIVIGDPPDEIPPAAAEGC